MNKQIKTTFILILTMFILVLLLSILFSNKMFSTQYLSNEIDIKSTKYYKKNNYNYKFGYFIYDQDYYGIELTKNKKETILKIKDYQYKTSNENIIDRLINFDNKYFIVGQIENDIYSLKIFDFELNNIDNLNCNKMNNQLKINSTDILYKCDNNKSYYISIDNNKIQYELINNL